MKDKTGSLIINPNGYRRLGWTATLDFYLSREHLTCIMDFVMKNTAVPSKCLGRQIKNSRGWRHPVKVTGAKARAAGVSAQRSEGALLPTLHMTY